jgi:hypothetical protein
MNINHQLGDLNWGCGLVALALVVSSVLARTRHLSLGFILSPSATLRVAGLARG